MNKLETTEETMLPFQERLLEQLLQTHSGISLPSRRPWRFKLPAITVTAVVVVMGVVFLPVTTGGERLSSLSGRHTGPLALAAEVQRAVSDTDQLILHSVDSNSVPGGPDMRFEGWFDQGGTEHQRLRHLDGSGTLIGEILYERRGDKGVLVSLDPVARTWWTRSRDIKQMVHGSDSCIVKPAPDRNVSVCNPPPLPKDAGVKIVTPATMKFREEIAAGTVEVNGRELMDGQETIHVRDSSKPGMQRDFWVDATTFLPIRKVTTDKFGNRFESRFEWLPRTQENLRLLEVDLEGFSQVAPPTEAPRNSDGTLG